MTARDDGYGGFTVGPSVSDMPSNPSDDCTFDCERRGGPHACMCPGTWTGRMRCSKPNPSEPFILALLGGPGTGKSTTAAQIFSLWKTWGHNVEQVGEVAKTFTWRRDWKALGHQGLIHGLQTFEYDLLAGEVEGIVTDTHPLLSIRYAKGRHATQEFCKYVYEDWRTRNGVTVFIERDPERAYNPYGRRQSEDSAKAEDEAILGMLHAWGVPFQTYSMADINMAAKIAKMGSRKMHEARR